MPMTPAMKPSARTDEKGGRRRREHGRAAFKVESVTRASGEPLPVDSYELLIESAERLLEPEPTKGR